jgi:sulfite exporter TauE/SafE
MNLPAITGPGAAFVAGLVTSIHCIGMCGPLVCAVCPSNKEKKNSGGLAVYHGARLIAYSAAGVAAGLFGEWLAPAWNSAAVRWIPWLFLALFVVMAFGLERRVPVLRSGAAWVGRILAKLTGLHVWLRSGALGSITPLIPCGPLYLVLGVAVLSGSAWGGGLLMASFALGTIPLAFLAQAQWFRLAARFKPSTMVWIQRGLAGVAAVMILVRLAFGSEFNVSEPMCPFCH